MINLTLSVLLALNTATIAQAYEVKNDKTIEASAASRAAARIGDIRGSITYDQQPVIVHEDHLDNGVKEENSNLSPRPAWTPEEGKKKLPPMVNTNDSVNPALDPIATGSIKPARTSADEGLTWEVFDKYGRPVKLD